MDAISGATVDQGRQMLGHRYFHLLACLRIADLQRTEFFLICLTAHDVVGRS